MSTSVYTIAEGQDNIDPNDVIIIFRCLLADIVRLSRVPLGAPDNLTYEWLLKEAPKLDKELLLYIEGTGTLPVFPEWLEPLLESFLSTLDGKILGYVRQLLLFCYKIELEPTNEQIESAQKAFLDVEEGVAVWDSAYCGGLNKLLLFSSAQKIVSRCIYRVNWREIIPSHGPGAVYPSEKPWNKSNFTTIYSTIDRLYPFCDYFVGLPNFWDSEVVAKDKDIRVCDSIVSRLVAVPKDSRGPRLICVHPKEAVWIQQGCRVNLERAITDRRSPCFGRINFQDQGVNGKLALQSSIDRELVTLDLKEASDRISCLLVRHLFGDYAYEYLSCSRADKVQLMDKRIINLKKWAPMGNALTFPVQSLLFFSLVQAGIRLRYGVNCNEVYVFGDDILFPRKFYDGAVGALIAAGLVPNVSKTFQHGFFRESCGVDAYRGIDVTPHRLRRLDTRSVSGALSACTLAKAMYIDGYHLASDSLYRLVTREYGELPLSNNPNAQGLYRYEECSFATLFKYEKSLCYHKNHHKWRTKLLLVRGSVYRAPKDSWWNLQDSILRLTQRGENGVSDRGLEYAVPHRERLQRGWADALMPQSMGVRPLALS